MTKYEAVAQAIKTDIENSVILIRPLEGLFDEN